MADKVARTHTAALALAELVNLHARRKSGAQRGAADL